MTFSVGDRVRLVNLGKFSFREKAALQDKVGVVVGLPGERSRYYDIRMEEPTGLPAGESLLMREDEIELAPKEFVFTLSEGDANDLMWLVEGSMRHYIDLYETLRAQMDSQEKS